MHLCNLRSFGRILSGVLLRRPISLGIRREDKTVWESRTPLPPSHVQHLLQSWDKQSPDVTGKEPLKVIVQPCKKRIYTNEQYEKV